MIKITGWQKSSFIEFPGTVSTVLFLSGCNLRCPYCHNPGIVLEQYEPVPFDDIRDYITKHRGIIEGAVISGGEPSLHGDLPGLCDELKSLGLKVKIDTNGLEPEKIIACDFDYLALDIKTSFQKYPLLKTSYPNHRERLAQSVDIVKSMGGQAEVRITAVPGIVDRDDIGDLCTELCGVNKIFIQQFNPGQQLLDDSYQSINPYTAEELEIWQGIFLNAGINCSIRGTGLP